MDIGRIIAQIERVVLVIIIGLTVIAVLFELLTIWEQRNVAIADILLLFLYTEVVSMAGAFYTSRRIPTVYPLLIAITALSRLIVLQSKEMEPATILYEAGAIVILALAVAVLHLFAGEGREDTDLHVDEPTSPPRDP
ncbi:MAG: phosphate-starvation-inducible PsiE family protein [Pseudomonadota bacterium]